MTPNSEADQEMSTPQTTSQVELPQPKESGDYQRTSHRYWQVVDSDPNGLNCRMGQYSIQQIQDPGSKVELDIDNWPVVGALKQGQDFEIYLGPSGLGVLYDEQNQPWFFVEKSDDPGAPSNCFVRANSSFVQPVQPK
ncbi:MAG: hypothetical protein HC789_19125 [Microcoleus sp. CSU_2_2]|nr:hypothetical protein [Microcoleus sp. SU_5_3]NJS12331.1 hypothetical protein [Microcoleus sp. CSU_2_2]